LFDDPDQVIRMVVDGVGTGAVMASTLAQLLKRGELIHVLKYYCPSSPGNFLYYLGRRNQPAPLRRS